MKICVLGVGAFGFALLDYLSQQKNNHELFAYEKNEETFRVLKSTRKSPFFFPETTLSSQIQFIDDFPEVLLLMDIVILAIPNQHISGTIRSIKQFLKNNVCILNVSKGINNETQETVSDILKKELCEFPYSYGVLSGGMIAQEVIDKKVLGADIGVSDESTGRLLKELFESPLLSIHISHEYKNIELYGALKNLIALYIGYREGKGDGPSTLGYYLCEMFRELNILLPILGGSANMNFSDFALGGDIIATCFGNSRNRYLGKLVGNGKSPDEALDILLSENKRAEGFDTLKGLSVIIRNNPGLFHFQILESIFCPHRSE